MKIYSRGNAAKQWMLEQIQTSAEDRPWRICDIGCGYGSIWPAFLQDHPQMTYVGIDTDTKEIARAKKALEGIPLAQALVADGQVFRAGAGTFDVVTAFSALEHVVHLESFVQTVLSLLKPHGRAYLNYDAGHFRSSDVKERIMVPVSQLLARVGIEGPYMKEVDDKKLMKLVEQAGGRIVARNKFNLSGMKRVVKGEVSDEVLRAWFAFEEHMNTLLPPEKLDPAFWSTVLVVERV
ncbi:MAG: methyltransferase domain-containing protein [Patescibacteria group bacterium]